MHMKSKVIVYMIVSALLVLSTGVSAENASKTVTDKKLAIDVAGSRVNWLGKKPAGEHVGYVKLSSGELLLNKNEVTGGSFVIELNTITNTDLKDEGMNSKLVGHLKSADFFDVAKYPTARFVITKVTRLPGTAVSDAKATHRIEGDLTIKGITKRIGFDATISILNGKVAASTADFTIDRTQWGVNYQSKSIFSELKDQFIYDDMTLSIELVSK
jgi:polyisoprenoid-binding protein YceI